MDSLFVILGQILVYRDTDPRIQLFKNLHFRHLDSRLRGNDKEYDNFSLELFFDNLKNFFSNKNYF